MLIRFAAMSGDLLIERQKQRWWLTVFFFISGVIAATWSSRIPDIQQKLGLSNAALGTVLFAVPVGLATGLSFSSWAVVRFGARRMMLLSSLFAALVLALAGMASTPLLLMIILFCLGMSRTLLNLSANTEAIKLQEKYERPILAMFHGVWSVACFGAAGISAIIIAADINPWYHFVTVAIVIGLIAMILSRKQIKEEQPTERRPFFVMPDKYLFLLGLMALCSMLCEGAVFDWSVNYFEKVVGAKKSMVMTGYLCFIITMSGGRLVGDRFIHSFGVYRMLFICGLMMAVGFFVLAAIPYFIPAAIGFLLIGIGDSILVPALYMLASRSGKMSTSYALSSVTLIGYGGFIISPLLIGNVSQLWGMPAAFFILSGVSLVLILLSTQVKKLTTELTRNVISGS